MTDTNPPTGGIVGSGWDGDGTAAVEDPVIECRDLRKHFTFGGGILASLLGRPARVLKAVDGVDLTIRRGEVFGLVGESGSGKSTLAMSLVKLHTPTSGTIWFQGRDVTHLSRPDLKAYRRASQMIFQDPYGSLNPRLTVAQVVEEPLRIHGVSDRGERAAMAFEALRRVSIPPGEFLHRYPYELSGGQRQRIAVARAIVLRPEFIVADEPVSMLDVSIQASVLELIFRLSRDLGLAILYVSHDIATVRYITHRVAVMYGGTFVEYGNTRKVMSRPSHPYTQRLMAAVPSVNPRNARERVAKSVAGATGWWVGEATDSVECGRDEPHWLEIEDDHFAACPHHAAATPDGRRVRDRAAEAPTQ